MSKLPWLVIAAPLLVACQEPERQLVQDLPSDWGRRECPKEWYWESLTLGDDTLQVIGAEGRLTGPGPIQNVPEFHDCQRFIFEDADRRLVYGEYFAIFAVYDSSRLSRTYARGRSRTATLALLDTLEVDSVRTEIAESAGFDDGWAIPAAEIVAWQDYDPLGIKSGFNCLYVYRGSGSWQAEVLSFGNTEQDCRLPNPSPGSGIHLEVTMTGVGFPENDYPLVARWDWDETNSLHYIGITCGAAWCEVHWRQDGATQFASSPTVKQRARIPAPAAPDKEQRMTMVKGWYDEQFLAVASATGNQLVPSQIRGAIVPHHELGDYNTTNSFADKWVLAAQVALWVPEGMHNPYSNKFNLSATPNPRERMNEIHLCSIGPQNNCAGAEAVANCNEGDVEWRAKIIRAEDGDSLFKCVKRCDMDAEEFLIPGTARWRWKVDDEGMWMRCRNGCCEIT
ncbi:MAG: hypothetical protein JSW71_16150 [Gemmatimonadota bacterium]|nr:MAG: hypothetical protein JSW71_16150 [Gemmatimonadota bacterium]